MSGTITFSQSTGIIRSEDGGLVAFGWAGHGEGKNNPALQASRALGPLPQGLYTVGPWEDVHPGLGPIVARLIQVEGETFGRDAFYIHGPAVSLDKYGQESKGCIVVPRAGRLKVKALDPEFVRVLA